MNFVYVPEVQVVQKTLAIPQVVQRTVENGSEEEIGCTSSMALSVVLAAPHVHKVRSGC